MLRYIFLLVASCTTMFVDPIHAVGRAQRPFIVFSPPRAGTHMHAKALEMLVQAPAAMYISGLGHDLKSTIELIERERQNGRFVVTHHLWSETIEALQKLDYRIIFVQRDPRDQLVSIAHFLRSGQWPWIPSAGIENFNELIEDLITGKHTGWRCVDNCYLNYEAIALTTPAHNLYISRFEQLVGPHGGGSEEEQLEALFNLAAFLDFSDPLTMDDALYAARNLFGGTPLFRHGQIGEWRTTFTSRHKFLFDIFYGRLLGRLNYQ